MAILTESGRVSAARYLALQPLHMAWGNGLPDWDTNPSPNDPSQTDIVNEIGRLKATRVQFCLPDPAGEIELPEGTFAIVGTPTKYLMLTFDFEYTSAVGQDIRDLGVFIGTKTTTGIPPETKYLIPSQVAEKGMLLVAERVSKFTRTSNVKQRFIYVIQF